MIKLSKFKLDPNNPRLIKDYQYKKLLESLKNDPEIMSKKKIFVENYDNMIIGAGTQRYRCLRDLGYKEIPETWVDSSEGLTKEQWEKFKILDNTHYGEFDNDMLANIYDVDYLAALGVDVPIIHDGNIDDFFTDDTGGKKDNSINKIKCVCPKCGFEFEQ